MPSFSEFKAPELKQCAKHYGMKGCSKMKKSELVQHLNKSFKVMKSGEVRPRGKGGSAKDFFVGKDSKPTALAEAFPECYKPKGCTPRWTPRGYDFAQYKACVSDKRKEMNCPKGQYVDPGKQAGILKPIMQLTDAIFLPAAALVAASFPVACGVVGGPPGAAACATLVKKMKVDEYLGVFYSQADLLPGEDKLLEVLEKKGLIKKFETQDGSGRVMVEPQEGLEEYQREAEKKKQEEEKKPKEPKKPKQSKPKEPEPIQPEPKQPEPKEPETEELDFTMPDNLTKEEEELFREIFGGQLGRSVLSKIQKIPTPVPKKRGRKKLAEKK